MKFRFTHGWLVATALLAGLANTACGSSSSDSTDAAAPLSVVSVRVLRAEGGRVDWSPPTISPGWIAYDVAGPDGCFDVRVVRPDSSVDLCLTCDHVSLGLPAGNKSNPVFHPSGEWLVIQVEIPSHPGQQCDKASRPGAGYFNELWALKLSTTGVESATQILAVGPGPGDLGTLHPHFSHDGGELGWSHIVKGPTVGNPSLAYGEYVLRSAPFSTPAGVPTLGVATTYAPGLPSFREMHAFSQDGTRILYSGNPRTGQDVLGIDILELERSTNTIAREVTHSDKVWDEHAQYVPGSDLILFTSNEGYPFSSVDTLRADYYVAGTDGSRYKLTHFDDPTWGLRPSGFPDVVFMADGAFSPDGQSYVAYAIPSGNDRSGPVIVLELTRP